MSGFVPLRVRSHGSLLCGTASPDVLVTRALELGYDALALADRDNLYLAIRFIQRARAEGLAPITGAELTASDDARAAHALLLAIDRRGYTHLCEILTRRRLDPAFDLVAALAERHAGLHVIVESPGLLAALVAAGVPPAHGTRDPSRRAREGGLWLGVRGLPRERPLLATRLAAARALHVPPVATGDITLLAATDFDAHRVAMTAAAGELLDRMPDAAFCAREAWLASPAEWARRVRALCTAGGAGEVADECLANNAALAARCRLELELGVPVFPIAPLPDGVSGMQHLRAQCLAGVSGRYAAAAQGAARQRLESELSVIERMGFTDYFLLVAEIVGFARARGIPTVGRGSGAGSIVSYLLGITNVDPIRHRLYFERFLHPARRDCPDLDIDLCWQRRDEVIAHVYDTYGADRVAMISTHSTLGARSAFRETAKALGIPNPRVNALARRVPRDLERPFLARLEAQPGSHLVDWREPVLARALALAEPLAGAPRHLSVHCGGVVIGDRPLTHYVPLERAAKDVVVTQFEMRAIEAVGLVKMDLLGNRALSTMSECITLVRERRGEVVSLDDIPGEDAITAARLATGDTLNGFQLESPAMRHLLRMLECSTLEQTIAAVALVRPGAAESGMKEAYCRRHRGLEPVTVAHPSLNEVLGPTLGAMLYEEDVMRVASAVAGLSLPEGDDLRRVLGQVREPGEFESLERGFVRQCGRNGVDTASARAVWRDLTRFAAYAFCKAHAAGYGTLGWQSAWLKTRYPAEWATGVLNHHAGMYATWVHVEDLRRHGVRFEPPCTQRSAWATTLERDAVRIGLGRVFGLATATAARIEAARPCASLADFVDRARPTLPELEALIACGALDWTARSRPSLLLEARVGALPARRTAAYAAGRGPALRAEGGVALLPQAIAPVAMPVLPEFDAAARVRGEARACGLWFSAHPLDVLIAPEQERGSVPAAEIQRHLGRRVRVTGLPCASRRVETKSGGIMLFVTLADRSGLAECVLFPDAYHRLAAHVRSEIVTIEGRVDETLGAFTVSAERAWALGQSESLGELGNTRPSARGAA